MGWQGHFRARAVLVAGLVAAAALSACSSPEADAAAVAANRFVAFSSRAPEQACKLLAPETKRELEDSSKSPCAKALPDEKLPKPAAVTGVDVAGDSARVTTADQTLFLARFDFGWKVTAAGCKRQSSDDSRPYACPVKGG